MMGGEGMNEQTEERSVEGNKDNESGTCEERRGISMGDI